jgi:signal transduction histidine kinase
MQKLILFYNVFIPSQLKDDPFIYRKAKVLTNLILFLILTGIALQICKLIFNPDNPILIYPGIVAGFILLFLYKKTGNSILVSNLLALCWVLPLMYVIPDTKGLYSDNLLWLFLAPLCVLLFANRKYGAIWLCVLLAYTYYLYLFHSQKTATAFLLGDEPEYYLISYAFLFIAIFFVVAIFETGQLLTIQLLTKQKIILEEQKQEIARKNAELCLIEEQLRESNQELENFAFAASHDLKEPLRMIGMYTQLTQKRLQGQLDGSTKEFMGYVTDGVGRMQNLLDSLLDYSRLGKNQDDLRAVNLNDTIFMVIHNLMPRMKETKAAIVTNPLPTIQASSFEMIQLFQNLIANSIKFRRAGVAPKIEIRVSETITGDFIFTVADNGIGIPEQHQERVFKIFERLHTRIDYEGSGIGLATCKKIIQSSGGKIWLESTEGVGTTFHFTLPKVVEN